MLKYFVLIFTTVFYVGCSSQNEISKSSNNINVEMLTDTVQASSDDMMNLFIDGSVAEAEGNYDAAVNYFNNVLKYEKKPGVYYALAKNYLYLNKLSLALQNAKKAVGMDSTQIDFYNVLSDIYMNGNQPDSAAVVLNKIIQIDSSNLNAYYRLAGIYEKDKPMKAISIYNKITSVIGPDWNVLMHVAEIYSTLGNYTEAAGTIEQLLTIDPNNFALQKLLSEYYQRADKYDKALKVINEVLKSNPEDLDALNRKAQIYLAKNDWESAAKVYDYILNKPKIPVDLKIKIGASYFEQSFKDSTLLPIAEKFFKTIDKDTAIWQVKMYLGAIAINQKKDSLALKDFKAATKLASWNVETWVRLGGLYFDNKKYDDASKVMTEAIKSFPEDFRVNLILGLSLAQSNHNKKAKPYLKKAVQLNPKDITALSAYGFTLSQLKENTEAIKYLNRALKISPNDVNLLGTLGLIYDGQKDWVKCDSIYEKALAIDSTNALINNNYAYSLSERGIKLDRAMKMAKIAINAEPTNSSYLDTMGWIYFKMNDFDSAKKYVKKSIKINNKNSDVYEHLGDIESKMGNKKEAIQAWQKALDLNKDSTELKQKIAKGES
jgi:tetratricopeptide (TPR) repeat protein